MTTTLGYARCSTTHQTLDAQRDALTKAGAERIFTDKLSGARDDRPGLLELLAYAREGDVIVVVALDRLGRSLTHIIKTIEDLQARGIQLRSLREGVDFSGSMGKMVAGIFASLAEYERSLILERAAAARQAAKDRGEQTGRPRVLTAEQVRIARRMRESGEPMRVVCEALSVKRSTLYRALADEQVTAGA